MALPTMTLGELIAHFREIKVTQYDDYTLVDWVNELEGKLYYEIISWHECTDLPAPKVYKTETDMDEFLMVPQPYTSIYLRFLDAQTDHRNGDIPRYRNSMELFNAARDDFANWVNSTYLPKQPNRIRI